VYRLLAAEEVPDEPFEDVYSTSKPTNDSHSGGGGVVSMDVDNGNNGGETKLPAGPSVITMRGHTGPVHGLSWSPEQQYLLSGSIDSTVSHVAWIGS